MQRSFLRHLISKACTQNLALCNCIYKLLSPATPIRTLFFFVCVSVLLPVTPVPKDFWHYCYQWHQFQRISDSTVTSDTNCKGFLTLLLSVTPVPKDFWSVFVWTDNSERLSGWQNVYELLHMLRSSFKNSECSVCSCCCCCCTNLRIYFAFVFKHQRFTVTMFVSCVCVRNCLFSHTHTKHTNNRTKLANCETCSFIKFRK